MARADVTIIQLFSFILESQSDPASW